MNIYSMKRKTNLTEKEKMIQAMEYTDMLLTLRLCAYLNQRKTNKAVRGCAKALCKRMESINVKMILITVASAELPLGRLKTLEKQCASEVELKEFFKFGIEAERWVKHEKLK